MAGVWEDWSELTNFLEESWMFLSPDQAEPSHLLLASVLIHSYALAESTAAEKLQVEWRELGTIERWGTKLLEAQGKSWSRVSGGLYGAVEVAVARNAFAHGQRVFDVAAQGRLDRARPDDREVPERAHLDYGTLRKYRGRLKSLMNQGAVG